MDGSSPGEAHAPLLSVVVPAYNEEKLLAGTLHAIRAGLLAAGFAPGQTELRVADNDSSDATAAIAAAAGASVVHEPVRQIARARNAGARDARGDWLLFVDADTQPSAGLLARTRAVMLGGGCCGGGALISGRGAGPGIRLAIGIWNGISRLGRVACGAYLFCRADAFRELGGFDESLYAAEELDLSQRLKAWGRARGLRFELIGDARLDTSLRKLDLYSPGELTAMALRGLLHPRRVLRERRFLDAWYDGRR